MNWKDWLQAICIGTVVTVVIVGGALLIEHAMGLW